MHCHAELQTREEEEAAAGLKDARKRKKSRHHEIVQHTLVRLVYYRRLIVYDRAGRDDCFLLCTRLDMAFGITVGFIYIFLYLFDSPA